jgi:hypothetical protein
MIPNIISSAHSLPKTLKGIRKQSSPRSGNMLHRAGHCLVVLLAGVMLSSCNDYLNVLPLNDIVLENYWKEKADVESVLNACYAYLESSDCITRMGVWGELRSDNMVVGSGTPTDIRQILQENLLQSNSYNTWVCFYKVINYCNTVIKYAPLVQNRDPNYSESEMKSTIAEASALRDLCYFYLIRAFRDVPYSTDASTDDTQEYRIPASSFDTVLTAIIADLEKVQNDAVKKYSDEDNNTTRITRTAIWAMLADMYLWKQDYDNSIRYCDLVIERKIEEYKELKQKRGENIDVKLYNNYYPLICETNATDANHAGNAYDLIFGESKSFESIFELSFVREQSVTNGYVDKFYQSSSQSDGYVKAADFLVADPTKTNNVFKKTDNRYYENFSKSTSVITKYAAQSATIDNVASNAAYSATYEYRSSAYANWIIYRFTDVMLIKAEAEIERAGAVVTGNITQDQADDYQRAFSLISVVYNRANNITDESKAKRAADTLVFNNFGASRSNMEKLLLLERQRELMYEGKRWFDLVRFARREGKTSTLSALAVQKQTENINAIKIKLGAPDYIYFPYSENELKVNPYLKQNPAFTDQDHNKLNN